MQNPCRSEEMTHDAALTNERMLATDFRVGLLGRHVGGKSAAWRPSQPRLFCLKEWP